MTSKQDAATAVRQFLLALGCSIEGPLANTPERVATLWTEHMLWGEQHIGTLRDLPKGTHSKSKSPVSIGPVAVHLVCPHHLTIAFGQAHVAYIPNGHILSFGSLAHVIRACTTRLVLQEEAANDIAHALVHDLGVKAAVAFVRAIHPCHNVPHAQSHQAEICTWGMHGPQQATHTLHAWMMRQVDARTTPQKTRRKAAR